MVRFTITGAEAKPEVEFPLCANVHDLKLKIEEKLKVKVDRQTLLLGDHVLRDDRTLDSYCIRGARATIHLVVAPLVPEQQKIKFKVKSSFGTVEMQMREMDMVANLRKALEKILSIPRDGLSLFRLDTEMHDEFPLSQYYVCEGAEIHAMVIIDYSRMEL